MPARTLTGFDDPAFQQQAESARERVAAWRAERQSNPLAAIDDLLVGYSYIHLFNQRRSNSKWRCPVERPEPPLLGPQAAELSKLADDADALIRYVSTLQVRLCEAVEDVPRACILGLRRVLRRGESPILRPDGSPECWAAPTVCTRAKLGRATEALLALRTRVAAAGGGKPAAEITLAEAARRLAKSSKPGQQQTEIDRLKSTLTKACKRKKDNPRHLKCRKQGRNVYVSFDDVREFCDRFYDAKDARTHRRAVKANYISRG